MKYNTLEERREADRSASRRSKKKKRAEARSHEGHVKLWKAYMVRQVYKNSPRYKYNQVRANAIKRGIPWEFSFEEWFDIWQQSGHWEERGPVGYVMCRKGDTGGYNKENVYIATQEQNLADAWTNGRRIVPRRAILTEGQVREIKDSVESLKVLGNRYGVHISTISKIRTGVNWRAT